MHYKLRMHHQVVLADNERQPSCHFHPLSEDLVFLLFGWEEVKLYRIKEAIKKLLESNNVG